MSFQLTKVSSTAAAAAFIALGATLASADAKDWRRSVDNHYAAVEQTRYVPRGDSPQWNFSLDTVVNDMAWRQRTVRMLRHLPKPGADPADSGSAQLADRPEPPRFRFSF